jgi:hypothetical protein
MSLTQSGDQETTFEGQIPNDDDNEIEILSDTEGIFSLFNFNSL